MANMHDGNVMALIAGVIGKIKRGYSMIVAAPISIIITYNASRQFAATGEEL